MGSRGPLDPGHIDGQNPGTPERLPGHTAVVRSEQPLADQDIESLPAFHFRAGAMEAVALDSSGANLPPAPDGTRWQLIGEFTLGVQHAAPEGVIPEAILMGIRNAGYYAWTPGEGPSHKFPT